MTLKILFLISLSAFFASCASSHKAGGISTQNRLIFGNGGGFTGKYTSCQLNDDGRVYSLLPDSSMRKINRLSKKQTRALFAQAESLRNEQPPFNHPGNMTWFITYHTSNEIIEYKWGDSNEPVPAGIKEFYGQLITFVK